MGRASFSAGSACFPTSSGPVWSVWEHFCERSLTLVPNLGQSWQEKVASVREKMKEEAAMAVVVTALDEIACEQR